MTMTMTWTPTHWKHTQETWKTSKHLYQQLRKAGLKVTSPESRLTEELAQSISEDIDAEILRDLESIKRHDMLSLLPSIRPEPSEPVWCSDRSLWLVVQPPPLVAHVSLLSTILQPARNLLSGVSALPSLRFDLCQCGVCSPGATASKGWPEDCLKGVQFPKRDHEPIWGQDGQIGVFWSS